MLKHIVLFKLNDNNEKNVNELISLLNSMKQKIHQIKDLIVGVNVSKHNKAFDIGVELLINDVSDLNICLDHPYHKVTVMNYINNNTNDIAIMDFHF